MRRVLARAGIFAVSVEASYKENGFELRPTLRYAHSEAYLRALAERSGMVMLKAERSFLREEASHPIDGLYFAMQAI